MAETSTLKLLSYNIQAGTTTDKYRDYVTKSWRQVLPNQGRMATLESLAEVIGAYDIAGLQEVDDGSLRTGFLNQTEFLAERAGFRYWSHQSNRKVSKLARTCNGLLSRHKPTEVHDHKLPGRIPGRGALIAYYGQGERALVVAIVHLALGKRSRRAQLEFLGEVIADHPRLILMGDMNASADAGEIRDFLDDTGLHFASANQLTFPSWKPARSIDHIMVGPEVKVVRCEPMPIGLSDHLPVEIEIEIPADCSIS